MPQYANINPTAAQDGIAYALAKTVPSVEGDLYNGNLPNFPPVPVLYDQAILAVVTFTAGPGATSPTYCLMQTSVDNGATWIDVAWCQWAGTSGTATFVLSGGVAGANAFQQTRKANTAPGSSGFNQVPLGGLVRFIGRTGAGSSASPSPGPSASPGVAAMAVTIYYRMLGLR